LAKFRKKQADEIIGSPLETMGFSKSTKALYSKMMQSFTIKLYEFSSIDQVEDIKKQLLGRKILVINAKEILENGLIPVTDLKRGIDEIKAFLREHGGSLGRIGDQYLILTPNASVRISN
jgi:SepF-like predicted cell division protein (DUF552 family)